METVEDIELIDPALSTERLVYRLFHERGVRVFRDAAVSAECSCSRENVANMLKSFSQDDRDHMVENGKITVTCEFCNSTYVFEPDKLDAQPRTAGQQAAQLMVRAPCGMSSEKAGISMSNGSPVSVTIP